MSLPVVRPPVITDFEDQNQRQARTAIKALSQPGVQRVVVKSVALSSSSTNVPHQLGRIPVGWQVTDKNAQADIWRDPTVASTSNFIALKASAAVTVDLIFW